MVDMDTVMELDERIGQLEAELAEARAQIAAKDAMLDRLRLELDRAGELIDADLLARAVKAEDQIAAKDAALAFYRDGFFYEPKRSKTGIDLSEWKPKEALLEDCGNRASAALKGKTE
jgi:multidrug resistance efflux pump